MKHGLHILADSAAVDVADSDVRDHMVVRVVDEVIADLMGGCGVTYADVATDMERHDLGGWRPATGDHALIARLDPGECLEL